MTKDLFAAYGSVRECLPVISIIVPVYNVVRYVEQTVKSILIQSFRDFECILVDDGSTDGSARVCDEMADKDGRVRVIHKPNGGLSDARNVGLDVARGRYIAFADSDDAIFPETFDILLGRISRDGLDVAVGNVLLNDLKTGEQRIFGPLRVFCADNVVYTWQKTDRLLRAMFNVTVCNKLFKREVFQNRRFIKGIKFEDVPMWTDVLFSGVRIGCVDKPVYRYNVNRDGSIITTRDYRGYPDVWKYQINALSSHGLFKDEFASEFLAKIVMKFIQAYNLSSSRTRGEFYAKAQDLFKEAPLAKLDPAHGIFVAIVEYVHYIACRTMPHCVYNILFVPEKLITNTAFNSWLRKRFQ